MNIDWWTITYETLLMTLISTVAAYIVGMPLGILLNVTGQRGLHPNKWINVPLGIIVNFLRSVPCLIMVVLLLPLTRAVMGRGTGEWYTIIIPLFFCTFGYVARTVEQSLSDVDNGELEAAKSMGATDFQLVTKVMMPEARTSLITGAAVTAVNVIGYTSFAYNIGAGGLISEIYSFYTKNTSDFTSSWEFWVMIVIVVVIIEVIQEGGLYLAKKLDKRRKIK